MKLYYKLNEKKFIKEMDDYCKTIIILTENHDYESAYNYKLSFYARMFGFLDKITEYDFKDDLSIDANIYNELFEHLYNDEIIESKNCQNIYYSYYKGKHACFASKKNVLNKILDMHLNIIKTDFVDCEKENNQFIKENIIKTTSMK